MPVKVRRIISGEDPSGKAVFTRRDDVPAVEGMNNFFGVWGWESMPTLPAHPTEAYTSPGIFPDIGGARVNVVEFPALGDVREDTEERKRAGEHSKVVYREPGGMHKTDTLDVIFVISGAVDLEQDDGVIETLREGDVLIQYGARHAWRSRPETNCVIGVVVLPAERVA